MVHHACFKKLLPLKPDRTQLEPLVILLLRIKLRNGSRTNSSAPGLRPPADPWS
jgi:hypothetical protein